MSALVWAIKGSLVDYIEGMADGMVSLADGTTRTDAGFFFPALPGTEDGGLRFGGSAVLTGHGGMLRVAVTEPHLEPSPDRPGDGWILSIADPDEPGVRLPFAAVDGLADDEGGTRRATGTRLTAEGAGLFVFGPYTVGTPLDDPVITG